MTIGSTILLLLSPPLSPPQLGDLFSQLISLPLYSFNKSHGVARKGMPLGLNLLRDSLIFIQQPSETSFFSLYSIAIDALKTKTLS